MKFKPTLSYSRLLVTLSLIATSTLLYADNFVTSASCNGIKLLMSMPESEIEQHCKVTKLRNDHQIISGQSAEKVKSADPLENQDPTIANLSKIAFTTDDGSRQVCYYRDNRLVKCKLTSSN